MEHCDVCRAFDEAPHVPIAGTSTVSTFNEKVQVDLLCLDDLILLRAMDMFSKYSLPPPVQPKNPQEVWDASCGSYLGTFGPPECIRMDEGDEWKNKIWIDLCAGRRIKVDFN